MRRTSGEPLPAQTQSPHVCPARPGSPSWPPVHHPASNSRTGSSALPPSASSRLATAHYEGQGWTVEKIGKPYDLRGTRDAEEHHVEVEATAGAATSVELTINEILHARDKDNTVDPYAVSGIRVDTATDPYTADGGTVSLRPHRDPAEEGLGPRTCEYRLPDMTA